MWCYLVSLLIILIKQTVHCTVLEFFFSKYFHTELFGRHLLRSRFSLLSELSLDIVTKLSALLLSYIIVGNNFNILISAPLATRYYRILLLCQQKVQLCTFCHWSLLPFLRLGRHRRRLCLCRSRTA